MAPDPLISAMVNVSLGLIRMYGFTFQPRPKSRDDARALAWLGRRSVVSAMPPHPFSPVKFSGEIERVCALERRYRLPRLTSRPFHDGRYWAKAAVVSSRSSNVCG